MGWRTVIVSNPARLRIENSQLIVAQDEEIPLPLDEIDVLLIESQEVTLTAPVLHRLSESGGILIVCDSKHLPCFAGIPFAGHSRLAGTQRMQLAASLPLQKRIWQRIVRSKIANQAECLRLAGRDGADKLRTIENTIASGDSTYGEARAARLYFPALFGKGFEREDANPLNAALNYGYAVIRAVVARSLAAHGFLLSCGVHHHSELNAFNLADDFIEPLRPVVDLWVAQNISDYTLFGQEERRSLVTLLAHEISMEGKRHAVSRAAEMMAGSFLSACRSKSANALKLPSLLPLTLHAYE